MGLSYTRETLKHENESNLNLRPKNGNVPFLFVQGESGKCFLSVELFLKKLNLITKRQSCQLTINDEDDVGYVKCNHMVFHIF